MEEEAGVPAPVEGPEDEAEAGEGSFPKIFDIKVLNNFMSRSSAHQTKTKGRFRDTPEAPGKNSIALTGQQAQVAEVFGGMKLPRNRLASP